MKNKILTIAPKKIGNGLNNNNLVNDYIGMVGNYYNILYDNNIYSIYVKEYNQKLANFNIVFNSNNYIIGCKAFINCNLNRTVIKGINDINTKYPQYTKYFVNIEDAYTHSSGSHCKVLLKCPVCGFKKKMAIYNLIKNGFSCSRCSDGISYPNKFMLNLLTQLNINFETEKHFDWCNFNDTFGIYDFYIPSMNLIIEMDGGLGHGKKLHGKSKYKIEDTIAIDYNKDNLANEHGIEVIRIDCEYGNSNKFDYIKNKIINSNISNMINLDNIEWTEINKNSCKSLLIEACNIYNNNKTLTTTQIGLVLNKNRHTINRWLKIGKELEICDYIPENNIHKINKKSKPIAIIDKNTNKIINTYESCNELINEYKEYNFYASKIYDVANGKRKSHKGFIFKYLK